MFTGSPKRSRLFLQQRDVKSEAFCPAAQFIRLLFIRTDVMPGRFCSFPNCPNKITPVTLRSLSFHRVPIADEELLKRWLVALEMEPSTPAEEVKREDHKVCSVHFDPDDFYPRKAQPAPVKKTRKGLRKTKPLKEHLERTKLKPNAVPRTGTRLSSEPEVTSRRLRNYFL